MTREQPDQVERYRLETQFHGNCIRHTKHLGGHRGVGEKVKEDWRNCGELGRGGSSVVDKQREISSGRYRAVKAIDKRRLPPGLDYSRELRVMVDLAKHESLFMQFLGWFEKNDTLYIAMEYIERGDLRKHISKPLPEKTVQRITNQLLEGLKVMHEKGIAHRDLKPENIFVVSTSPIQVKLGDFGISKRIRAQDLTAYRTQFYTRSYAAPEVLGVDPNSETSAYTKAVDIWSLGCVVYELLVAEKLFGPEGLIHSYFHGRWSFPEAKLKNLTPPINDAGISLIKSMISLQSDGRPSAIEALGHTWIADLKNELNDQGSDDGSERVAQIPVDGEGIGGVEVGERPSITAMEMEQSDLVELYRLETEPLPNHVPHTEHSENSGPKTKEANERWSNCEVLGEGGFSVVHKQLENSTGHFRAVKVIDKTKLPAQLDHSREPLAMAVLAEHPSLFVKFLGWFEDHDTLYIAMEYLEMGDLRRHIGKPLPQKTVQGIAKQLLAGLDVMHQKGIAHRDIKPEKIFVVSMSPVWVKLGGFSLSKQVQDGDLTTYHTRFFVGSYTAPEVLGLNLVSETPGYTNAVDTWSVGCVIYELLTGEMLFSTVKQISRYFFGKCGFPDDKLKGLSPPTDDTGISLINSMVSLQPDARPSAVDALNATWITDLMSEPKDGRGEGGEGGEDGEDGGGGEGGNGGVVVGDGNGEQNNGQEIEQSSLGANEIKTPTHRVPPIPYPGVPSLPGLRGVVGSRGKGSKTLLHKWLAHIASFWKDRDSRKASKDEKHNGTGIGPKKRGWSIKFGIPRGQKVKSPDI